MQPTREPGDRRKPENAERKNEKMMEVIKMELSQYAYKKGMTLDKLEILEKNIKATASAIIQLAKQNFPVSIDTGVYSKTSDLLTGHGELTPYIIQELKQQGMEFIENGEYWRY